jgi:phosphohistidine phosphatase SixA
MRHYMLSGVLMLALAGGIVGATVPSSESAFTSGQVLLIHHATADQGTDAASLRFADCATQRNLSDAGRLEAQRMGARLSEHGFLVSKVLVSPFCRTMQTATLMKLQSIEVSLEFQNIRDGGRDAATAARVEAARNIVDSWRGPGVLVVVTHSSMLKALTGLEPDDRKFIVYSNPSLRQAADAQLVAGKLIEVRTF